MKGKSETSKPKNVQLYEFYINNSLKNKEDYNFKDNCVDTKKYNIITFLPKALFYQFVRIANIYFLVSAILQCIPAISPLKAETALVPIIIVLSVSLIREAVEDYARAKLDSQQNSEPTEVFALAIPILLFFLLNIISWPIIQVLPKVNLLPFPLLNPIHPIIFILLVELKKYSSGVIYIDNLLK